MIYKVADRQIHRISVLLLILSGAPLALANSLEVANSFGPNGSYDASSALIIGDNTALPTDETNLEQALRFTVPGSLAVRLESLQVVVRQVDASPNRMDFHIRSDSMGLPGGILETISFFNVSSQVGGEIRQELSQARPILQASANYWLSASTPSGVNEGTILWQFQPATSTAGTLTRRVNSGPWINPGTTTSIGVFRLMGTPVPEPSSLLALACLACCQLNWLRRR